MSELTESIIALGYIALFATVFAESGLFFGFFLPGDSLLFTAGLFAAAKGELNIAILATICFVAAVLGDQVGYWFGNKVGKRLYSRPDSFFFRKEHVRKTQEFYAKHGKKTIVLARFVPIVRTFAPIVAGIADMDYWTFIRYNLLGGLIWGVGLPLLGYYIGEAIPGVEHYITPIVLVIIVASFIPVIQHLYFQRKHDQV